MIIKIDIDGVLRDIVTAMCQIYKEEFGDTIKPVDIKEYDINGFFPKIRKKYGITPRDYFFGKHAKEVFLTKVKPFPKTKEGLELLRQYGHKIVIVSWQFTSDNIRYAIDFLEQNDLVYDDICFTKDKWMINANYIIDDNPEFLTHPNERSEKICVRHPYNECVEGAECVDNLYEAAKHIIQFGE